MKNIDFIMAMLLALSLAVAIAALSMCAKFSVRVDAIDASLDECAKKNDVYSCKIVAVPTNTMKAKAAFCEVLPPPFEGKSK